jgi:hypothetical protein
MHVSPGYFKDVPGMQGGVTQPPQQQPQAPDVVKLIASWAPRTLNAGEVRALLGEAVKATKVLQQRVPPDVYGQVAAALKTFADIAGQTAGKAPDAKLLSVDQTKLTLAALVQFWRVAHAAGVASQTTLNLSATQGILKTAQKRMKTIAVMQQQAAATQEAPAEEKKGGMPTWGWVAIGVTVLAAVGTVIAVIYYNKREELPEGAEPLEPEAAEEAAA